MSQIIRITSEALQATVRRLLPSQQGFGEDLQASNVITPIIDLTPTAEGSQLPTDLARSLNYGGTAFDINNTRTTIANVAGFYRVFGVVYCESTAAAANIAFSISELGVDKVFYRVRVQAGESSVTNFDFTVFLDTAQVLDIDSSATKIGATGMIRNVADRYGNISNPVGFTFE